MIARGRCVNFGIDLVVKNIFFLFHSNIDKFPVASWLLPLIRQRGSWA